MFPAQAARPSVIGALAVALCAPVSAAAGESPPAIDEHLARRVVAQVTDQVEQLRGLDFVRPVPVRVIDDARAKKKMVARMRRFGYDARMRVQDTAYALLGLVPPGTDLLDLLLVALEEQAGGFYDPEDGVFYLLSDMPPQSAAVLVVHELTHALEDQHYDLDQRLRVDLDNEDRLFATAAVHEGSATLVMMVYTARALAAGTLAAADLQAMAETEASRGEVFRGLPPLIQRQILGPYLLGASFLSQGNLLGAVQGLPTERLGRAYRDGPVSSEQVLHPERFWITRDDPRQVELTGVAAVLGRGAKRLGFGCLGELSLGVLVGAPTPPLDQASVMTSASAWTNEAAEGWGGDRWELWRLGQQQVLVLLTVWDTEADAAQFSAALPSHLASERQGDRVAIVAGEAGSNASLLLRELLGPPAAP